jgi:hypothetical protein
MTTHCHIQLQLLAGGAVSLQADILGRHVRAPAMLRAADAVRLLEEWLAPHEHEPIDIVVLGDRGPLATWNTQSRNFALYWIAAILGHSMAHEPSGEQAAPADARRQKQVSGFAVKAPEGEALGEERVAQVAPADEDVA